MSSICFVTEELFPVAPGGAGMLIYNSIKTLRQRGHRVSVLLESSAEVLQRAREVFQGADAGDFRLDGLYGVAELTGDLPAELMGAFDSWYLERSYRMYRALVKVTEREAIDWVEFNDFFGPAYCSLAAKAGGLAFEKTRVGVRLHSPWELLVASGDGATLTPELMKLRNVERGSLRLAEHILSPSDNYARDVYGRFYPPGLGDVHASKPDVLKWPTKQESRGEQNVILFYGRLHPCKGLDRLLPAALEMAHKNPQAEFAFVGGDSNSARDQGDSYRELMEAKVPADLKPRFHLLGRMNFEQVGELLGRTRFAIFASYLESFCYAAHELKRAGVPLLVVNSPVFSASFRDGEDAAFFDGSVGDLVIRMQGLWADEGLRQRITQPCLPGERPLGSFYDALPASSWMDRAAGTCRALVLIVCDGGDVAKTTASLRGQLAEDDELLLLTPPQEGVAESPVVWVDRTWQVCRASGEPVDADAVRSRESLLVLWAGDTLAPDAVSRWRRTLAQRQAITFVTGWRRNADGSLDLSPIETCLETLLFAPRGLGQRTLLRTPTGRRLEDLFDPRLGILGEIGQLWTLDDAGCGLCLPEVMVTCREEEAVAPVEKFPATVSYLVTRDHSVRRQKSLAYWATIATRQSAISATRLRAPDARLAEVLKGGGSPAEMREEIAQLLNDLKNLRDRCDAAEAKLARLKNTKLWKLLSKSKRLKTALKKLAGRPTP